jgi:hypothetical protein
MAAPAGAQAVIDMMMPQMLAQLAPIRAELNTINAQMAQITAQLDQLTQNTAQNTAQIAQYNAQNIVQFENMACISYNAHASRKDDDIRPLQNPQLPFPPNFPRTKGELFKLSSNNVNTILIYYNLPIDGTVSQKRSRLAQKLGLSPRE